MPLCILTGAEGFVADKGRLTYCVSLAIDELCRHGVGVFATFTFQENVTDKAEAERRWRNLKGRIQRKVPTILGVHIWQRQKRGAWHIHAVFNQPLDVSWLRPIALECGFGTFLDLRYVGSARGGYEGWDRRRVVGYITRYITRDLAEEDKGVRLVGYTGKARVATQRFGWSRGISYLYRCGRGEWRRMFLDGALDNDWDRKEWQQSYWFAVRLGWEVQTSKERERILETSAGVRAWWLDSEDPF